MAPLSLLSAVSALSLSLCTGYASAEPGVVGLSFRKREITNPRDPALRLRRRQGTPEAIIYNAQGNLLYLVNTTVGTPPQSMELQLDTGSSDIWIPTSSSSICQSDQRCVTGSYDQSASSTFEEVAANVFQISYVDGTKITGDYINETFGIAGAVIQHMTMGTALQAQEPNTDDSTPFQGIIGVAFDSGEAIISQAGPQYGYPNIISQMVLQGVISTRAYSLWLNDLEAPEGEILFGGIDNAKFEGNLTILPLQASSDGVIDSFTVAFAGVNITGTDGRVVYSAKTTAPVILDSGTTLTYLPDDIANAIADGVGAITNSDYGVVVPCSLAQTAGRFQFQFGNANNGPIINAEISQFVIPFPSDVRSPKFKSGQTACRWGIQPSGDNPNLFGDTFLRSAYVVYNLEGNEIGIGQTIFNATKEEIKPITEASSLPGATSTASGGAVQTRTGPIRNTIIAGATGSAGVEVETTSGLFDLGTATGAGRSAATSSGAAVSNVIAPSTPFVSVIAMGMTVLLGLVGGSVLVLA